MGLQPAHGTGSAAGPGREEPTPLGSLALPPVPKHTSTEGSRLCMGGTHRQPQGTPGEMGKGSPGVSTRASGTVLDGGQCRRVNPCNTPGRGDGCGVPSFPSYNQAEPHGVSAQSSGADAGCTAISPPRTVETHHQKQRASPEQEHGPGANLHQRGRGGALKLC